MWSQMAQVLLAVCQTLFLSSWHERLTVLECGLLFFIWVCYVQML